MAFASLVEALLFHLGRWICLIDMPAVNNITCVQTHYQTSQTKALDHCSWNQQGQGHVISLYYITQWYLDSLWACLRFVYKYAGTDSVTASGTLICQTPREEIGQYYLPIQYPATHFRLCPIDTNTVTVASRYFMWVMFPENVHGNWGNKGSISNLLFCKGKIHTCHCWILIIIVLYREFSILRQTASTESAVSVMYYMWKTEATPAIHRLSTLAYKHKRRTERIYWFCVQSISLG